MNGNERWDELQRSLVRLGVEEVEQRLEAGPVIPGDPMADICCGCTCDGDPKVDIDVVINP